MKAKVKSVIALGLATCLLAAGCSAGSDVVSPRYETFRSQPVACGGELPEPAKEMTFSEPEDQQLAPNDTIRATIETSCGNLVLELDQTAAPNTVNSFVFLSRKGFYDGVVSHRIAPNFVLQIGDQSASGGGDPGYKYADELPADRSEYTAGSVVMANSGPDTNGSQIFINFVDNSEILSLSYSKFGELVEGEDVLQKISEVPVEGETPTESMYINSIEIDVS